MTSNKVYSKNGEKLTWAHVMNNHGNTLIPFLDKRHHKQLSILDWLAAFNMDIIFLSKFSAQIHWLLSYVVKVSAVESHDALGVATSKSGPVGADAE
jgi:hypothetical protein